MKHPLFGHLKSLNTSHKRVKSAIVSSQGRKAGSSLSDLPDVSQQLHSAYYVALMDPDSQLDDLLAHKEEAAHAAASSMPLNSDAGLLVPPLLDFSWPASAKAARTEDMDTEDRSQPHSPVAHSLEQRTSRTENESAAKAAAWEVVQSLLSAFSNSTVEATSSQAPKHRGRESVEPTESLETQKRQNSGTKDGQLRKALALDGAESQGEDQVSCNRIFSEILYQRKWKSRLGSIDSFVLAANAGAQAEFLTYEAGPTFKWCEKKRTRAD